MNEKDLLQLMVTLPHVLFLALGGGLANFIMKLNQATTPQPIKLLFLIFIGEMFLSGFAGLTTFLLCHEWGISPNYTAVMVAMAGHLGGNAITQISKLYENLTKRP
ncbi:MAG: phage holin family protein [Moraxella sp.]|nr:phage holin family protein [Moraxella sp.]